MNGDIGVVLGTRPEIIKLAPVIRELGDRARIIHTGQHYDEALSGALFDELRLPPPSVVFTDIGGRSRAEQVGRAVLGLSALFDEAAPAAVIVQGDTNAVNAGAQAAHYAGIPLLHVEAGLRSYDRAMPEEINRLMVGVLADVHCAPTYVNEENLLREGIPASRIAVTGNTVVEATLDALTRPSRSLAEWFSGAIPDTYVLATIHRPENTDTKPALERILSALHALQVPVVFLAHPRTRAAIARHNLEHLTANILMFDASGSSDFLALARHASLVISDSGGVQEEVTVLKVPLLVVRNSTERPEAVDAGFATLIRPDDDILAAAIPLLTRRAPKDTLQDRPSPYGDGLASRRIALIAMSLADGHTVEDAIDHGMRVEHKEGVLQSC